MFKQLSAPVRPQQNVLKARAESLQERFERGEQIGLEARPIEIGARQRLYGVFVPRLLPLGVAVAAIAGAAPLTSAGGGDGVWATAMRLGSALGGFIVGLVIYRALDRRYRRSLLSGPQVAATVDRTGIFLRDPTRGDLYFPWSEIRGLALVHVRSGLSQVGHQPHCGLLGAGNRELAAIPWPLILCAGDFQLGEYMVAAAPGCFVTEAIDAYLPDYPRQAIMLARIDPPRELVARHVVVPQSEYPTTASIGGSEGPESWLLTFATIDEDQPGESSYEVILRDGEASVNGGVIKWSLVDGQLSFWFGPGAIAELGVPRQVHIQVIADGTKLTKLNDALRAVLGPQAEPWQVREDAASTPFRSIVPAPVLMSAGIGRRAAALGIDVVVMIAAFAFGAMAAEAFGQPATGEYPATGLYLLAAWMDFGTVALYEPACWLMFGRTIGQRALGLSVVVSADGARLGAVAVAGRYVAWLLCTCTVVGGLVAAALAIRDPYKRTFPDLLAGSSVIRR